MRRAERWSFPLLAAVLAGALCLQAEAQEDNGQDPLAGRGPLEISADRAELSRDGVMRYSGNVEFTSSTLRVTGEQLELKRDSEGHVRVRINGTPAALDHTPPEGAADRRPVHAEAERIVFYRNTRVVEMEGEVALDRGGDKLRGNQLRYDMAEQRITASGDDNGSRVRITIDPDTIEEATE